VPVLDDAIGVGVLGTELGDDGSIRGTFEGGCVVDIFVKGFRVECLFHRTLALWKESLIGINGLSTVLPDRRLFKLSFDARDVEKASRRWQCR
jgi:hypothetical protein